MLAGISLQKQVGEIRILRGVDLPIEPGTATAILGPNGSGKTTLLRALALVDPPTSGRITVDEKTYVFPGAIPESPWPKITIVFQQLFLWPHLTIRHNLLLPVRRRFSAEGHNSFPRLVERFELGGILDRHPNEVSVGERQRVAIVRALLLNPTYLLLDEATSALDVEHTERLLEVLQELKAKGVGIAFVTHLLGMARRLADHILFLDGGRVLESGGTGILSEPRTPRVRSFLSLVEAGMDPQGMGARSTDMGGGTDGP